MIRNLIKIKFQLFVPNLGILQKGHVLMSLRRQNISEVLNEPFFFQLSFNKCVSFSLDRKFWVVKFTLFLWQKIKGICILYVKTSLNGAKCISRAEKRITGMLQPHWGHWPWWLWWPQHASDWSAAIQAGRYCSHPSSFNKEAAVVIAVCEESIIHADIQ